MKTWRVTDGKTTKTVEARHARSAANKAFRLGYGFRWDELDPDNAWAYVQAGVIVSDGKNQTKFVLGENG